MGGGGSFYPPPLTPKAKGIFLKNKNKIKGKEGMNILHSLVSLKKKTILDNLPLGYQGVWTRWLEVWDTLA
jgi:hypothetical protein